jgi:drug/metabolite transporter (DMT)-like permease
MKISKKLEGYLLRSIAVVLFGLEVIFLKYTSLKDVSPLGQTFLYSLGIFFVSIIFLYFYRKIFLKNIKYKSYKKIIKEIPKDKYFFIIIIGNLAMTILMAISLKVVESTTFMVINNLSPVFALIIGIVIYKKRGKFTYFKDKKNIVIMLFVFLMGSIGTIIVSLNSIVLLESNFSGILFSLATTIVEVITVVATMKYAETTETDEGSVFTGLVYLFILISILPFVFFELFTISISSFFWGLLTGFLSGIAFILSYPIYKRMDSFIAYLFLNFAVFVTFSVEFILGGISFSFYLLIGGFLVIFSSIFAEMQNIKLQKEEEKNN